MDAYVPFVELTIDLLTGFAKFIIEFLHYTAWPITIVLILWFFKEPIYNRILKGGAELWLPSGIKVKLEKAVEKTIKKTEGAVNIYEVTKDNLTPEIYNTLFDMYVTNALLAIFHYILRNPCSKNNLSAYQTYLINLESMKKCLVRIHPEKPLSVIQAIDFADTIIEMLDKGIGSYQKKPQLFDNI